MGKYRVCCCFTRKFKVAEADPPPDVLEAFREYSDGGIHMTVDQLLRFIEECQDGVREKITKLDVERLLELLTSSNNRKTLTLQDFHRYLFQVELNPPIPSVVHQDMTAPLSHYFIYAGQHLFMSVDRLSNPFSVTPIIAALRRGVRVIELDLWLKSYKDNVIHARTSTTLVDLERCLKSIKENGFVASPYPVIITLETHLTPNLQAKVAQMVTETFGEMLFCPESGELKELPSPESLKYRILFSAKPPIEYLEAEGDKRSKSRWVKDPTNDDARNKGPSRVISYKEKNNKYESDESDESDHDNEDSENHIKTSDSCFDYKNLIAIHAVKPKGGLVEALKVEKDKVKRLSLSEQALGKAAEHHQQQIIKFTEKNLLRIYPEGNRFTLSNYKPLIGWLHGAQIIAFNMEGYGSPLWLMHGMFRANGGCGYVKKPDFLIRPNNELYDRKAKLPVKTTLMVKLYMGDGWHLDFKKAQSDAYYLPNFYTRVAISGAPADAIVRKTKPKEATWMPVWNEEFTFKLTHPELALLKIEVHEYDVPGNAGFAGQSCFPVSELRPGIRAICLYDSKGYPYVSTRLLMRFKFVS